MKKYDNLKFEKKLIDLQLENQRLELENQRLKEQVKDLKDFIEFMKENDK